MLTVLAFIVALALLIAIHEYGHYRMAVACGVKVLRFSIGFGRTLLRWQPGGGTEFVVCAFPLGGYVRMLDEREAPVTADERHLAFNTQPLRSRALIVAAGPVANLLLAVLLYAVLNWSGVQLAAPVLASPVTGSVAQRAGLTGGERVESAGFEGDALRPIASFEDVRWLLTRGALEGRDVRLSLASARGGYSREVRLPLAQLEAQDADEELFRRIGIVAPFSRAVIGRVNAAGAADRAGLRQGDVIVRIDGREIVDGRQVFELVRASVKGTTSIPADWQIERNGRAQTILVSPDVIKAGDRLIGRIDAYVAAPPELVTVNYGPLDGLWRGAVKTWDLSLFTLRMMGKMVMGDLSLKNLSGPLTIADYAGRSASMGLVQYLGFLALISVSLGVLNLLPLPVLDGGHLMYYLWEGLTGKSVSDVWLERLQRVGVAVLAAMMSIALFNDLTRLWG